VLIHHLFFNDIDVGLGFSFVEHIQKAFKTLMIDLDDLGLMCRVILSWDVEHLAYFYVLDATLPIMVLGQSNADGHHKYSWNFVVELIVFT
jgi:hypothetical protein